MILELIVTAALTLGSVATSAPVVCISSDGVVVSYAMIAQPDPSPLPERPGWHWSTCETFATLHRCPVSSGWAVVPWRRSLRLPLFPWLLPLSRGAARCAQ